MSPEPAFSKAPIAAAATSGAAPAMALPIKPRPSLEYVAAYDVLRPTGRGNVTVAYSCFVFIFSLLNL